MPTTVLLITPPFTQLNTPYPATAYLKGFLNTINISSYQCDLGLEVTLQLFSKAGLSHLFSAAEKTKKKYSENSERIYNLRHKYKSTVDAVIQFLQGNNPTLATAISNRNLLPEAARFAQLTEALPAFGSMGINDKAKHIATLYLEDIADFIKETVDENFGFSRYAEQLARSANSFSELHHALQQPNTYIDEILLSLLQKKIETHNPMLVALTAPFPGNVYSALKCGQYLKKNYPYIKIAFGGGFANTELRSMSDNRILQYVDYITLDDGELPLENILKHLQHNLPTSKLKRTYTTFAEGLTYVNNTTCTDYKQADVGTPDYSDLLLTQYINAIEVVNPMHKLWSDGRWNKLTMAHGCYWGKCTFCDTSLPYIADYEPIAAVLIVTRMEQIIAQTNSTGFHFVDEAAPPSLMKNVAIEIIKRGLIVTWWTNVRFEKSLTQDLCYLLAASGCIAISGGLEVASDRLLQLIDKGITVAQVANVTNHLTKAGIMVHAYLMYGYPTQTEQETVDSLEMVRQLFTLGIVQSGFWHRFALTAHSPIGLNSSKYGITQLTVPITFANNDVAYTEHNPAPHDNYTYGLKKSLLNYMLQAHTDKPLSYWFEHKIPKTTIAATYLTTCIQQYLPTMPASQAKVIWLGNTPHVQQITLTKKGKTSQAVQLTFANNQKKISIQLPLAQTNWLLQLLPLICVTNATTLSYGQVNNNYTQHGFSDFILFWHNKPINKLTEVGLLVV